MCIMRAPCGLERCESRCCCEVDWDWSGLNWSGAVLMAALLTFGLVYRPGCVHAALLIYCSQKGHMLLCIAVLLCPGSVLQTDEACMHPCMHAVGGVITVKACNFSDAGI